MSYCYDTGTYNQYPSHYVQSFSSSANFGQGEYSIQNFPPAPVDFLNWDDFFLTPPNTDSVALPIQTGLSAVPLLPHSYLDIVANSSRALPVASPIPVLHAALTKAALRTMMSFDDKGNIYRSPLINLKKLNWHERHLQEKENETRNFAGGSEPLKFTDAPSRTRVDFDNHALRVNGTMNCNALVNSGSSNHTTTGVTGRSKLVIRPISPSTLMALTEPCLMAWCTAFDESLAEPGLSDYLPLQSSDYNNYVDKKDKAVFNAWGY